ncbi:hypothetical protein QJS10_CPB19g00282 [Acorus calamus]|uniref:Uncharacterized protein n=1 Tax=Acorus calamus TaxID=4465 RepID=A0AAV9CFY6_ACOCL|nr:hypothetical protein QJS10_CPB19g00282 [Acorus calamus]
MYPSQPSQYPPQSYSGYQQPPPQRSTYGWEQRPSHPPHHGGGGYDYYGQGGGGHVMDGPISGGPPKAHGPPQANYYGAPPASEYGQHTSYPQSAPPPQQAMDTDTMSPSMTPSRPSIVPLNPVRTHSNPAVAHNRVMASRPYNKPPAYGMPPSQGPSSTILWCPSEACSGSSVSGTTGLVWWSTTAAVPTAAAIHTPMVLHRMAMASRHPVGLQPILNRGSRLLHQVMLKAGMANPVGMVSTHNHNPVMASRSR